MAEIKNKKRIGLGGQILIGIVIGVAIGFISPSLAAALEPLGDIFLRLLKMIMVPLVFFSITSGVCKMGDVKQLATVGVRFVLYIIITSGLSALIGVICGLIFQPGRGTTEFLDSTASVESVEFSFIDNVVQWVPDNVVSAMANANMLQVIVFALFLGVALLSLGDKASLVTSFIDQCSNVMLKIVEYIMAVSPIGIASLMATMVSTVSGATMKEVISFILMDYGCAILILVVLYPIIIRVFAHKAVIPFFKKISEPMIVAATTTSSAATLPISIKVADEKLGVPENIYGFTLPLGNTCGMNGFAMFIGLCCIFACNLYGMPITAAGMVQYIFLGIILSIGAAGVKGAGIVMSTVLLEAIGMPLTLIPILAAIWPAIDPPHTVLNNTSDLIGTIVIADQLDKVDEAVYNQ